MSIATSTQIVLLISTGLLNLVTADRVCFNQDKFCVDIYGLHFNYQAANQYYQETKNQPFIKLPFIHGKNYTNPPVKGSVGIV